MTNTTEAKVKEIKDYLHLYLGCDVIIENIENESSHLTVESGFYGKIGDKTKLERFNIGMIRDGMDGVYTFKPILRLLSSMTEEEEKELDATKVFVRATPVHMIGNMQWTAESYRWMLSKYFDLFGLIDAGLAIDKTKLP